MIDPTRSEGGAQRMPVRQPLWTEPLPELPEASADLKDRVLGHVDALMSAKRTDTARWENLASHRRDWAHRGRLLASFVKPDEAVFEFGAGNSAVPTALPAGCTYAASDASPLYSGIIPLDLNSANVDPLHGYDTAVLSAVLEYVHDLNAVVHFLAQSFSAIVFSYPPCADRSPPEVERRRYNGWFTDLTAHELLDLFQQAGFAERRRGDWRGQLLARVERAPRSSK